jgi:hypothetical protein
VNIENQGILGQPKKPGPLQKAAIASAGILSGLPATDPDTDGRRTYSAGYGDAFANRGGYAADAPKGPVNGPDSTSLTPVVSGIAAPSDATRIVTPTASRVPQGIADPSLISSSIGAAAQGSDAVAKPEVKQASGDHGVSANTGIAAPSAVGMPNSSGGGFTQGKTSYNVNPTSQEGITKVTAQGKNPLYTNINPEQAVAGLKDQSIGGDPQEGIARMARANATRQDLIDNQPVGGGNFLPDRNEAENAEKTARWRQDDLVYQARQGNQAAIAAVINANSAASIEASRANTESDKNSITARGQDVEAKSITARLAGNPTEQQLKQAQTQGQQLRNEQTQRLNGLQQQLVSETDPAKRAEIAGEIKVLSGKTEHHDQGERLTLPQRRSNFEIEAARKAVAGLTPDEIKKRTQQFSATGRESPEYDPTLAKAITQANHRLYGAVDDWIDQRQQAQQPSGNDGDVKTRFQTDTGMKGHVMGKQTDMGVEVLDASGKLIGHYR